MNEARFRDRSEAGRRLASALNHYAGRSDLLLLGLARGGVPVAYEVATAFMPRWTSCWFGSSACPGTRSCHGCRRLGRHTSHHA